MMAAAVATKNGNQIVPAAREIRNEPRFGQVGPTWETVCSGFETHLHVHILSCIPMAGEAGLVGGLGAHLARVYWFCDVNESLQP